MRTGIYKVLSKRSPFKFFMLARTQCSLSPSQPRRGNVQTALVTEDECRRELDLIGVLLRERDRRSWFSLVPAAPERGSSTLSHCQFQLYIAFVLKQPSSHTSRVSWRVSTLGCTYLLSEWDSVIVVFPRTAYSGGGSSRGCGPWVGGGRGRGWPAGMQVQYSRVPIPSLWMRLCYSCIIA
jgi:hypothetical protein